MIEASIVDAYHPAITPTIAPIIMPAKPNIISGAAQTAAQRGIAAKGIALIDDLIRPIARSSLSGSRLNAGKLSDL